MEGAAWLPYAQLIWLIAVDYETTRQEFAYLAEAAISTGLALPQSVRIPMSRYEPCALRSITGCVVETRTLIDFRKALTAKPPDLVIICEPGLIDNLHGVMELIWGRVAEKRGCVVLAGTSDESSEEWYELWSSWRGPNPRGGRAFSIPTWDNSHRFPRGRTEDEFKVYEEMYGEEALLAHYGGVPASPRDLVLRNFWDESIHVDDTVEFDPIKPIEIAIDPNYSLGNRYVVEAVQWDYGTPEIRLVDEVAEEGLTHDQVRAICEQKPWWRYVAGGTIDPYAGESHVYGAPAPLYYWEPLKLRMDYRPRVPTTVQALKEAMAPRDGGPRLRISPRCERFRFEAPRWRNERSGNPSKNNCDALKGTGYWLVDHFAGERAFAEEGDNLVRVEDWNYEG